MSKPTNKPGWTSASNPSSEPTVKKTQGWSAGEKPSAEHMNWLFKTVSEWIDHVDADQVKGEAGDQGPQGAAGSGSLSATDEARLVVLESKARVAPVSTATMPLSFQGASQTSEFNNGNSGSAKTISWSNGAAQSIVLNADAVISLENPTSGGVYHLRVLNSNDQDQKRITWPSNVSWASQDPFSTLKAALTATTGASVVMKTESGGYVAWGLNQDGELGNGAKTSLTVPSNINYGIDFSQIKGSQNNPSGYAVRSMVGLDLNGYAYGWGRNNYGEVGDGTATERLTPTATSGGRQYQSISYGMCTNGVNSSSNYVLAIEKVTGHLYSWGSGDNYTGALGRSSEVSRYVPGLVTGNLTWKRAHAGGRSAGITTSGAIYTWGGGSNAAAGTASANIPALFDNSRDYSEITGTSNLLSNTDLALFALDSSGIMYSWNPSGGTNSSGILGDGTTTTRNTISQIAGGRTYTKMSCGKNHAAAIEAGTNRLYVWGNNSNGQVGDGTTTNRPSPTLIAPDRQFSSVVCGDLFTMGIEKDTNDLYVWGSGVDYRLGTGSTSNVLSPTRLDLSNTSLRNSLVSLRYDGTNYTAHAVSGFLASKSGSETKNGYVAGGAAGGSTSSGNINDIQKINFNNDAAVTICSNNFGLASNSTGSNISESLSSSLNFGFGTQSSTAGYRMRAVYSSLPALGSNSTSIAGSKMTFSTEVSSLIRTADNGIISNNRRPVAQSESAAFILGATSPYSSKLLFSTDTYSTPSTITSSALVSANYAGALSSASQGIYFDGAASSTVRLLTFSTETMSTATAPQSYAASCSELVDAPLVGYSQNTAVTTSGGTSNCRKYNKTTYANSLLASTLTGVGGVSAATQGSAKGYFCGGQNYSATNYDMNTAGATTIKQIDFASEAYSTSSAILKKATICGAGFEG